MIEWAAKYTREHITDITQNAVKINDTKYEPPDILDFSVWTKSKNRLIIIVDTLIDVALGHPYYPEHDVGIIALENWYGLGYLINIFMKHKKNIIAEITKV